MLTGVAQATRPVRALDLAHSRAKAALERVDDVLDLQQCLGSIRQAMRSGDYLVAATTCKRYHAVEKVVRSTALFSAHSAATNTGAFPGPAPRFGG